MASRPLATYLEDEHVQALQSALDDIWAMLKARDPDHDWNKEIELKIRIAEKLMDLPTAGVTYPKR